MARIFNSEFANCSWETWSRDCEKLAQSILCQNYIMHNFYQ
jgi:hypothetical protein